MPACVRAHFKKSTDARKYQWKYQWSEFFFFFFFLSSSDVFCANNAFGKLMQRPAPEGCVESNRGFELARIRLDLGGVEVTYTQAGGR